MKCPNKKCALHTVREVTKVRPDGSVFTGCPVCVLGERDVPKDVPLPTGKKFWIGEEAYGLNATLEKNFLFEEKVKRRARQRNILTTPPSQRSTEDAQWIKENPPPSREAIA